MNTQTELKLAETAAQAAAEILRSSFSTDAGIESAVDKDIKTRADQEAERVVREILTPTGIPILGEEFGGDVAFTDRMWIVDPLDGTMNFTRGYPMHCVSIALWEQGKPVLGVIHELETDHVLSGVVGEGVTYEGMPVQVSAVSDPGQAILSTGFPSGRDYGDTALQQFVAQVQQFKKIRMIGCAALSLAYVARGVFDVHFEEGTYLWDVAAGLALVQAAGGRIDFTKPGPDWKMRVWADNGSRDFSLGCAR